VRTWLECPRWARAGEVEFGLEEGHVEQAFSDSGIAAHIREVSEDEVALYQAQGWVKLDHLIMPDLAAELLRHYRRRLGPVLV
jgi:hypothetical protein